MALLFARPRRFRRSPRTSVAGVSVPVAAGFVARLLGLALLPREEAPGGLLIPRCRSVHTFGMRFRLDITFLDADGRVIARREAVPPGRVVRHPEAAAVLEIPSWTKG